MRELKDVDYGNYVPFSKQYRKCRKLRVAFLESCVRCGQEMFMCRKYGGRCNSGKCREERGLK